jgi:hypothetical protein
MRNLKLEVSAPARTAALSLYPRVFTTALRSQMKYLTAIMIRNLFFVMVLFIFTSIWRVAYAGRELIAGFTVVQILWYLSFTEVVEMSKSRLMTPIQEEVKEGTIAYNLLRPYDYIWFYLVRGYGESLVALVPMLIVGGVASALLVGPLPGYAFEHRSGDRADARRIGAPSYAADHHRPAGLLDGGVVPGLSADPEDGVYPRRAVLPD